MAEVDCRLLAVALLCVCSVHLGVCSSERAKVIESSIDSNEDWILLTRHCFVNVSGFNFSFQYPVNYGIQSLLIYYDTVWDRENISTSGKNCSEKKAVLSISQNQIIHLTDQVTGSRSAGCKVYQHHGEDFYNCTDSIRFRSSRARWWYFVLARCEPSVAGKLGLKMEYKLSLQSGFESSPTGICSATETSLSLTLLAFSMIMTTMMMPMMPTN